MREPVSIPKETSIKKILGFIGKAENPYQFESTSYYSSIEKECYILIKKKILCHGTLKGVCAVAGI